MEGGFLNSGELAGLGRHMSSGNYLEPGRSRLWGEALGHLCLIGRFRGAGSSQVPGWAASWLCGLGQVTHPPEFQPPIGKMAHRV